MRILSKCALILGAAQSLFAQATGPTTDVYQNMTGEVSLLKYVLPANTRVNLGTYKDWVTWGAVSRACVDPNNVENSNVTALYTTKKIGTKLGLMDIQHCHGPAGPTQEGMKEMGTTSFTWTDGQLYPKRATDSKMAFFNDHFISHYLPVTQGVKVSARIWLVTNTPSQQLPASTAFRIEYYPGWNGNGKQPDTPTKENIYLFAWESNSSPKEHVYTLNFTPPFTGTIAIVQGEEVTGGLPGASGGGKTWLKAFTLQDGTNNGVVSAGSFVKNIYEPQYFIKLRGTDKVMVPDFGGGYTEEDPEPGNAVKQYTQSLSNKNQKWYIHPWPTTGFANIWTKDGALTSGPYWWHARSLSKPTLGNIWQQIQFLDQGNGYKKMKLGGKGPDGEDLYLTSYSSTAGDSIAVYFGGISGQEFQLLQADPTGGARYQLQMVHSNKCLGALNGSTAENAAVVQMPCNTTQTRQLLNMLDPTPNSGLYRYGFAHATTKRLDIDGGLSTSTGSGALVVMRTSSSSTSQQFNLLDFGDGTYSLMFKHSGLCADVASFNTADNVQLKQSTCNGGTNQRVRFIRN